MLLRHKQMAQLADGLILFIIMGLAAYTHLSHMDLVEFKGDESLVCNLAVAFLEGKHLPLIGIPSSVGIANPPAFVYLMAIPLAITRDAALATGFVGLLNVLAVGLCYRFCSEYFGRRMAQIASLLFAVNPSIVLFSRKIQSQDVLALFTLLFISSIFAFAVKGQSRGLILSFFWLALLLQLHFAAVGLIPLLVLVLFLFRAKIAALVSSAAIFALTFLPYGYWQLTHDWLDVKTALSLAKSPAQVDLQAARWAVGLLADPAYHSVTGESYEKFIAQMPNFAWLYRGEMILFLAGLGYLGYRWLKRDESRRKFGLLLLWGIVPVLFFSRHSMPIYPHYLLIVYPMPFIAIGILLGHILEWASSRWEGFPSLLGIKSIVTRFSTRAILVCSILFLVTLVGIQIYAFSFYISFIDRESTIGGYGIPLKYLVNVLQQARALNATPDAPLYVAASGSDLRESLSFLAQGRPALRWFNANSGFLLPPEGSGETLYLLTDEQSRLASFLERGFSDRLVGVAGRPGNPTAFKFYRLGVKDVLKPGNDHSLSLTLPNGLRLLGYRLERQVQAGDILLFVLYWKITQTRPVSSEEYVFFAHLLDTKWQKWGGYDGQGYPLPDWQRGDVVLSWFPIRVNPGALLGQYWLQFGMYRFPDLVRLPLSDKQGVTVGTSLRLGPVKVIPQGAPQQGTLPEPQYHQPVDLEGKVRLVGYDLDPVELTPGQGLRLILYWQSQQKMSANYTVFTHLLDADGRLISQQDNQPLNGTYPTSLWDEGEFVRDEYQLVIPANTPPGLYHIEVGMYLPETGQRLKMPQGDSLLLSQEVHVRLPR
ncbi:MAG: glycosyltransferase family 39 protein [Chloroflexi bacterium]|nr:glycosyltransferase family 39 protein [Chloroflexota bacterium]MCL5076058.1 glycosyltransferase family 39 protein [Chloroflexota bacterium]